MWVRYILIPSQWQKPQEDWRSTFANRRLCRYIPKLRIIYRCTLWSSRLKLMRLREIVTKMQLKRRRNNKRKKPFPLTLVVKFWTYILMFLHLFYTLQGRNFCSYSWFGSIYSKRKKSDQYILFPFVSIFIYSKRNKSNQYIFLSIFSKRIWRIFSCFY